MIRTKVLQAGLRPTSFSRARRLRLQPAPRPSTTWATIRWKSAIPRALSRISTCGPAPVLLGWAPRCRRRRQRLQRKSGIDQQQPRAAAIHLGRRAKQHDCPAQLQPPRQQRSRSVAGGRAVRIRARWKAVCFQARRHVLSLRPGSVGQPCAAGRQREPLQLGLPLSRPALSLDVFHGRVGGVPVVWNHRFAPGVRRRRAVRRGQRWPMVRPAARPAAAAGGRAGGEQSV